MTGHQRGECTRPRPTAVGVVRHPLRHEQRTEVGVAEAELAELAAVLGDLLGRVVGVADEDLLRGEHHLDGVLVRVDVERAIVVEVLEQVDAGEVARRVVNMHIFRTITHNCSIYDVAVVARLGQVEGELDAVVFPGHEADRLIGHVEPVVRHQVLELRRLGRHHETDVLGVARDRTIGDAKVVVRVADVGRFGAVFADVRELTVFRPLDAGAIDPAEDAERGQQPLSVDEQLARRRTETDVAAVLTVVHATVGVEQAAQERGNRVGGRLVDRLGHDLGRGLPT